MIITRSPLRITLGGGGTDLPSYYRDHEGFLIAAAINKYIYVNVMRTRLNLILEEFPISAHITFFVHYYGLTAASAP